MKQRLNYIINEVVKNDRETDYSKVFTNQKWPYIDNVQPLNTDAISTIQSKVSVIFFIIDN